MITSSQPFTVITSLTVMVWLSRSDFPMIWILSPGASCPSAVSYMIFPLTVVLFLAGQSYQLQVVKLYTDIIHPDGSANVTSSHSEKRVRTAARTASWLKLHFAWQASSMVSTRASSSWECTTPPRLIAR
jgi:hypothetical protein